MARHERGVAIVNTVSSIQFHHADRDAHAPVAPAGRRRLACGVELAVIGSFH